MKMAAPLLSLFLWIYSMISVMAFCLYYLACAEALNYNMQLKALFYYTASGIFVVLQLFAVVYTSAHIHIINKADI